VLTSPILCPVKRVCPHCASSTNHGEMHTFLMPLQLTLPQ
jgi:hypothetical protein